MLIALLQYRWLSKDYPYTSKLRRAYKIKGSIAILLILLSIAFGVALFKADDIGGQFLAIAPFPAMVDRLTTFDSHFGMDHRLRIHILLTFVLLGPSIVEAGKIRRQ